MRLVDLDFDDLYEGVDLSTVCELMVTIEAGYTNIYDFRIMEPGDLGPVILYVSCVIVSPYEAHAWILHQERREKDYFVGIGANRDYHDCVYLGCPELVRADCLLSLDEAVPAIEQIVDGEQFSPPLHWVSMVQVLKRLQQ